MLIKNHSNLERYADIRLERSLLGKKTKLGAFEEGSDITFSLLIPRTIGASGAVLRINEDGCDSRDIPFSYIALELGSDRYEVSFKGKKGLYFYEILLLRGYETLFLSSVNNHDFEITEHSGCKFTLLFYKKGYGAPNWVKGGVMYHIFADRFFKGEGDVTVHGTINNDWDNGIPQYAEKPGDPLSNDVFFGGNLWGVAEKLDYLSSLGVSIIYLSPIFASPSNHRYDTADYETVDGLLGGEAALEKLLSEAHKLGMKVILDGVFNHTGDDSRYFNRYGSYPDVGAYQSKGSPYSSWFTFTDFPDKYEAWWGIEIMPRLDHSEPECRSYFTSDSGIVKKWLEKGADGWRLDVADELNDSFLDELTETAKSTKDAFIIGEVWENAVTKTSYSARRRYFHGNQLDSVMNYPLRNAIIALLTEGDTEIFYNTLTELYSSYPKPVLDSLMNIISTHDTERIATVLGDPLVGEGRTNGELSVLKLDKRAKAEAVKLLRLASTIQFTVFGIPSVYYGDETALEGYHDPFCRLPFPWGREDKELLKHYRRLGALRKRYDCLKDGDFEFIYRSESVVAYRRRCKKDSLCVYVNISNRLQEVNGIKIDAKSFKII